MPESMTAECNVCDAPTFSCWAGQAIFHRHADHFGASSSFARYAPIHVRTTDTQSRIGEANPPQWLIVTRDHNRHKTNDQPLSHIILFLAEVRTKQEAETAVVSNWLKVQWRVHLIRTRVLRLPQWIHTFSRNLYGMTRGVSSLSYLHFLTPEGNADTGPRTKWRGTVQWSHSKPRLHISLGTHHALLHCSIIFFFPMGTITPKMEWSTSQVEVDSASATDKEKFDEALGLKMLSSLALLW